MGIRPAKLAYRQKIKASNEAVKNGLLPDPWVVEYRNKNNSAKARWRATQPKKIHQYKCNSGSFKLGQPSPRRIDPDIRAENIKQNHRNWRAKNKDKINADARRKRAENPGFKIACNLRKRLSFLLSNSLHKKSKQTIKYLGCDMDFFKLYLQSKFKDGMSLDNYGQWHIDHIKPCAIFDLTKETDIELCFHYSNMQPLWAKDNRAKSDKIEYEIAKLGM